MISVSRCQVNDDSSPKCFICTPPPPRPEALFAAAAFGAALVLEVVEDRCGSRTKHSSSVERFWPRTGGTGAVFRVRCQIHNLWLRLGSSSTGAARAKPSQTRLEYNHALVMRTVLIFHTTLTNWEACFLGHSEQKSYFYSMTATYAGSSCTLIIM